MSEEQQKLEAILKEDWDCLTYVESIIDDFETVALVSTGQRRWVEGFLAVTRGPSGQHYAWNFDRGLTEMQDGDCWDTTTTLVYPHEETVTVTEWKDFPA